MGQVRRVGSTAVALLLVAGGCSGDDGDEADASSTTEPDAGIHNPTSSTTLAAGGLDIDVPEGFTAIPLPSAGFGLAIPDGWEAAVLTDESLARLEALEASPAFVAAARNAAASGANLYAAGTDEAGGVADLKVIRLPRSDVDAAAVEQAAQQAVAAAPPGARLDLRLEEEPPAARIRFDVSAGGVTAEGTQWLIAGPDAIWSLVVTSEDPASHDALADQIARSLVLR
jgi:hypothetical protein